jgi:hypothetical protein
MGVTMKIVNVDIPPDLGYTGFMTHDELSKKLEALWHDSFKDPVYATLRAVVEYHEPFEFTWGEETETACYCGEMYPCPTIQTIERELNGEV